MRRLILSMLAACLLNACALGPTPMPAPALVIPPPPNLTAPPQPLPMPLSGQMRDLEANHRQVAKQYHQLARQLCGLLSFLQISPGSNTPICGP
jgi:hypothetical protein